MHANKKKIIYHFSSASSSQTSFIISINVPNFMLLLNFGQGPIFLKLIVITFDCSNNLGHFHLFKFVHYFSCLFFLNKFIFSRLTIINLFLLVLTVIPFILCPISSDLFPNLKTIFFLLHLYIRLIRRAFILFLVLFHFFFFRRKINPQNEFREF